MATLPRPDETIRKIESTMGFFTDDEWEKVEQSYSLWKQMVLELL